MPIEYNHDHENEITLFAETNFRNQKRRFGIKTDDRRRHMYVLGKTGMGKTTLLENMILSDIYAGHGCCYVDPHGDTAEKLIDFIPSYRLNDVVYFNPSDIDYPMGFNILEIENEDQKSLVAAGLMGVFKKIWPDVWSARMEYILLNCVLALIDYPGATLMGITRILFDKDYRAKVIAKIRDPIVKTFWVGEFPTWSEKYANEAIAPVQNKVGQFLSSTVVRNIVAQVKSTIDLRHIMDDGKILVANLSKGRIGEDNMRLLGGMLITKIQLAAQERQNIPKESDRRDFYLYVDEFQNFANESFATILSEARKYRLNLIVAHQYIEQLDEKVAAAIFGNVGTEIIMRVGGTDAKFLETEFAPTFTPEDLVNLAKFQIYLKLMVDGVATSPFSANTLSPIAKRMQSAEKAIQNSRERYAEPRQIIEAKVLKWSGMEAGGTTSIEIPDAPAEADVPPGTKGLAAVPADHVQFPSVRAEEEEVLSLIDPSKIEPDVEEPVEAVPEYLVLKPERKAAIEASVAQTQMQKKKKPQFAHTCSRCGKVWNLAIQLDRSRPMYCPECRPIILEEQSQRTTYYRPDKRAALPPEDPIDQALGLAGNRPRIVLPGPTQARPGHLSDDILQARRGLPPPTKRVSDDRRGPRRRPHSGQRQAPRPSNGSSGPSGPSFPPPRIDLDV